MATRFQRGVSTPTVHGHTSACLPVRVAAAPYTRQGIPQVKARLVHLCSGDERREIGCSELYNMVNAISDNTSPPAPSASTSSDKSTTPSSAPATISTSSTASSAPSPAPAPAQPVRGAEYYKGLVTSDLSQDNKASSADMLARSLQLAGGVAGVLVALVLAFLASNGLL